MSKNVFSNGIKVDTLFIHPRTAIRLSGGCSLAVLWQNVRGDEIMTPAAAAGDVCMGASFTVVRYSSPILTPIFGPGSYWHLLVVEMQSGYFSAKLLLQHNLVFKVPKCINITIVELSCQGRGPGRGVHGVPRGEAALVWPRLDEDRSRLLPVR